MTGTENYVWGLIYCVIPYRWFWGL